MYRVGRKLLFLHTEREICKLITGDDDGGRAAAGAVAHPRPLLLPLLLRGVPRGQRRQGEHSPAQQHQQPGRMHQAGQYTRAGNKPLFRLYGRYLETTYAKQALNLC